MFLLRDLPDFEFQFSFYFRWVVDLELARLKKRLKMNLFPALQLLHLSLPRNSGPLTGLAIGQFAMAGTQLLQGRPEPETVWPVKFDALRN